MIRAAALGLTLLLTVVLAGCGLVVTDEAPTDPIQIDATPLVPVFPEVEALAGATTRTLSLGRARTLAQRAALRPVFTACDDEPKGRAFALDTTTLVAHRDVIPGAGALSVLTVNGRSTAAGNATAYRAGELAVVRAAGRLPRSLTAAKRVALGAPVVVVVERNGKLRLLPGVVVDTVPGATFGVRGQVLRLSSELLDGDAGPVLDAQGRVVAAVFAVDPQTTLGVAVPASILRGKALGRRLETLDTCD